MKNFVLSMLSAFVMGFLWAMLAEALGAPRPLFFIVAALLGLANGIFWVNREERATK